MEAEPRALVVLTRARQMLAEAQTLEEVKQVHDVGQAAIRYCKARHDIGTEAEGEAAEIVRRAERRLGEMLGAAEKATGTAGMGRPKKGGNKSLPPNEHPTLSDLGISRMDSHRWQREATVPESVFEAKLAEFRQRKRPLPREHLVRLGKQAAVVRSRNSNPRCFEG